MKNLILIATLLITVIAPAQNNELFHDNLNNSLSSSKTEILLFADNNTINNNLNISTKTTAFFAITEEKDSPLELENWMTNETGFEIEIIPMETETDELLNMEDWMIEDSNFDMHVTPLEAETDRPLVLEDWMIDTLCWEDNIVLANL